MVLRLDPALPVLWRSPTSLQLGIDGRVVLEDVTPVQERIVAALLKGSHPAALRMIARENRLPAAALDAFLERLAPALLPRSQPGARIAVAGRGAVADELARQLDDRGVRVGLREAPGLVVIVADHLIAPEDHGRWLRRDIPHLPVVVGAERVEVGPLVVPGAGPCLYCAQLVRRDADPAWPALAAQLSLIAPASLDRTALAEAAALAVRRAQAAGTAGDGLVQRLRVADGSLSALKFGRHPECLCAALPETGLARDAGPATPGAPSAARAADVPA